MPLGLSNGKGLSVPIPLKVLMLPLLKLPQMLELDSNSDTSKLPVNFN